MITKNLIISIILHYFAAIFSGYIIVEYTIELRELWDDVKAGGDRSTSKIKVKWGKVYATNLWAFYVIVVACHSMFSFLDAVIMTWNAYNQGLDITRNLRSTAIFQIVMWSTVALIESMINYLRYVDPKYGRYRIYLCFAIWFIKILVMHFWRWAKKELKKKQKEDAEENEKKIEVKPNFFESSVKLDTISERDEEESTKGAINSKVETS